MHSPQICLIFVDHAGLSLNLTPSQKKNNVPLYGDFKSNYSMTTLEIITTIITYYATAAKETDDVQQLWDDMKREIQLQTQRYEEHLRREKNQKYAELEQQIAHLTKQQRLTETEERILNTVGTTLQEKFQQDAKRRILQSYNLNQHSKKAQQPIFPKHNPSYISPPNSKPFEYKTPLSPNPIKYGKKCGITIEISTAQGGINLM
jgi:hypothetical protein